MNPAVLLLATVLFFIMVLIPNSAVFQQICRYIGLGVLCYCCSRALMEVFSYFAGVKDEK